MLKKQLIPTPLVHGQTRSTRPTTPLITNPFLRWWAVTYIVAHSIFQRLAVKLWPPLKRGRYSSAANAVILRKFLERMGGIWIKAGHYVAMRSDVLGDAICDELSQLRDIALPMPTEVVRRTLEIELGQPVDEIFSEFDELALASTSIGQQHVARLRSAGGHRTVVKVLRPDVMQTFRRDLSYMRLIVWTFTRIRFVPHARWEDMLWEIEKAFHDSLDYRAEAEATVRMRKRLRRHKIYAPKVYQQYTRRGVLVVEFLQGVSMADYIRVVNSDPKRLAAWRQENGIDPKRVGYRLYMSHTRQIFEENMFHCEARPEHVMLLRNSRVALLNFASVGTFDTSLLEKYRMLYRELARNDYTKVCEIYMLLGPPIRRNLVAHVRAEVVRAFRAWEVVTPVKSLPYSRRSLTRVMRTLATIFARNKVSASWEFMRLNRSELALDLSLKYLIPEVDYIKLIRRYLREAEARAVRRALSPKAWSQRKRALGAVMHGSGQVVENMYFDGEWLRNRAMDVQVGLSKAADVGRRLLSFLVRMGILGVLFFTFAFLRKRRQMEQGSQPGTFTSYVIEQLPSYRAEIWVLIIALLLYIIIAFSALGRRLLAADARRPDLPR